MKKIFTKFLILEFIFITLALLNTKSALAINLKLPFLAGEKWKITQGYEGSGWDDSSQPSTHRVGTKDQFAIDFSLPGTEDLNKPILAANNGIVYLKAQKEDGELVGYGQYIDIDHGGGLISRYAHLLSYSVKDGEIVKQGQEIGRCDNTGYKGGSHLHFVMYQKQTDGKLIAYKPEPMSGYETFVAGNWYTSNNDLYQIRLVENNSSDTPWWKKFLGAVGGFFDNITQPIVHFVAETITKQDKINQQEIWQAEIISKPENLILQAGEITNILVKIKNTGNQTWLATHQISINVYDQDSKNLYHSSWRTRLRPAVSYLEITPGQTTNFSFQIQAPQSPGNYSPSFQIVYSLNNSSFESIKSNLISWQIIVNELSLKPEIKTNEVVASDNFIFPENPDISSPSSESSTKNDQGGSYSGGGAGVGGSDGGNDEPEEPDEPEIPIDITPPETTITNLADLAQVINNTDITFKFLADESATFECKIDAENFQSCSSPKVYQNLDEGIHFFQVRAIDMAENFDSMPAQFSWAIDLSGPIVTIISQPNSPTKEPSAQFEFSSTEQAAFECSLDDSEWQECFSPKSYMNLSEGAHLFSLRAKDKLNNYNQPVDIVWIIDTVKPVSSIITRGSFNLASWPDTINGISFSEDLLKIEIVVQNQSSSQYLSYVSSTPAWLDEIRWLETIISGSNWVFTLPSLLLSDNNYKIWSRAEDYSHNIQENLGESLFNFDTMAPEKINNPILLKEDSNLIFSWPEITDNLSGLDYYEVAWWNKNDLENLVQTEELIFIINNFNEENYYHFKVRAVDLAGNQGEWSDIFSFEPIPFLENWQKRKIIFIDNNQNSNELMNFEVNIPINYEPEMKFDFSDIRFSNDDGQTLLSYGWEINDDGLNKKEDGIYAEAVVKIPLILAQSQKKIYLYYGNSLATPIANLENTLSWFDHFNTKRTSDYDYKASTWQEKDSRIKLASNADPYICSYITPKNLSIKNLWLKIRMSRGKDWEAETRLFWRYQDYYNSWQATANPYLISKWGFYYNYTWTKINDGEIWTNPQNYILWEVKAYETSHSISIGQILSGSTTNDNLNEAGKIRIYDWWRFIGPRQPNMYTYVDYLYARQYTDPMPSVSFKQ